MSRIFIVCIISFYSCSNNEIRKAEAETTQQINVIDSSGTCIDYNSLNTNIRDGLITKQAALKLVQTFLPLLKNYFYFKSGHIYKIVNWTFPVQDYNSNAIGGTNGSGYNYAGYDYFDGNKHGGHPAHDIFIVDKNQDCIDDKTQKPVNVLSMTGGIVIATETTWDTTSNLRGGKYIWIYEPSTNILFYYAHNDKIFVKPCDIVKSGDIIGTVGRTGLNAFRKKSPTHLHFMTLKVDTTCYPKPINLFDVLSKTKTNKTRS